MRLKAINLVTVYGKNNMVWSRFIAVYSKFMDIDEIKERIKNPQVLGGSNSQDA